MYSKNSFIEYIHENKLCIEPSMPRLIHTLGRPEQLWFQNNNIHPHKQIPPPVPNSKPTVTCTYCIPTFYTANWMVVLTITSATVTTCSFIVTKTSK